MRTLRPIPGIIAAVALVLLIISTIWFFATIPSPPQHWFVYYFLAFVFAGIIWFRFKRASG